jgi:uncharacterized DUF497 family protein
MSHDPAKRRKNLRKHNVDLPGCMETFDGPMLTREDDREACGEQRLVSLGWAHGRGGRAGVDRPRGRPEIDFLPRDRTL